MAANNLMLEKELINFGLSQKAAKVYLASLELGPATVQQIANKADVNRPTTYVMIEALTDKGLISSFEKGKRRYFSAADPEQLLNLIREEKKNLQQKEVGLNDVMGDIRALMNFSSSPPNVSYYEGLDGVNALRNDVIQSGVSMIKEIVPLDEVRKYIPERRDKEDLRNEIHKKVKVQSLYSTSRGAIYPVKDGNIESRYVEPEQIPFSCEVTMYGNKTAFLSFSGKPMGFLVDSENVTRTLVALFDFLWVQISEKK